MLLHIIKASLIKSFLISTIDKETIIVAGNTRHVSFRFKRTRRPQAGRRSRMCDR